MAVAASEVVVVADFVADVVAVATGQLPALF